MQHDIAVPCAVLSSTKVVVKHLLHCSIHALLACLRVQLLCQSCQRHKPVMS